MIKQLLSLQFVFLFFPSFIISLVVFGSDFNGMTGWFYITALIVISILHLLRPWWRTFLSERVIRVLLLLAVLIGVAAYRQIHLNVWDEHSVIQALLISLFAVLSYFGSVAATLADDDPQDEAKYKLALVLLIYSFFWLPALVYPHSVLFAVVLLLGIGLIWLSWSNIDLLLSKIATSSGKAWGFRYLVFVLVLDASLVIWDYKVNLLWAGYLAISLLACALGLVLAEFLSNNIRPWLYLTLALNLSATVIFPSYILSTLHNFVPGLGLGLCMGWLIKTQPKTATVQSVADLWPVLILGMMVSYALYAHLSLTSWRLLFVIPLLYIAMKDIVKIANSRTNK